MECKAIQSAIEVLAPETKDISSTHLLVLRLLARIALNEIPMQALETLYAAPLPSSTDDFLTQLSASISKNLPFATATQYGSVLSRVLGCAHALIDPSLPIGHQSVGCALYYDHSFYQHDCQPNAMISTVPTAINSEEPAVRSQLRAIVDIPKGDPISISYIPLCGMAVSERQDVLQRKYHFSCTCCSCADSIIAFPPSVVDVQSIREIQYSCNERLLAVSDDDEDALAGIRGLVRMTMRGIQRQGIPANHEVSIEAHRLLLHCAESEEELQREWDEFVQATESVGRLYDMIVFNTERLRFHRSKAIGQLKVVLGEAHAWIKMLERQS